MQSSPSVTRSTSIFSVSDSLCQQKIAWIASGLTILVGCLVLIGWKLDLTVVKSGMSGYGTMKANTAACFILAGISLMLQTRQRQSSLTGRIAKGCAFAVSTIGLLTVCQYIFEWNLGIDELLVPDRFSVATSHPGRMGINTAVNFGLTGVALWLLARRSPHPRHRVKVDRYTIAHSLVVVVGFISLQAVVGHAYNVRLFYQLSVLTTSMALGTAITFGILGVGILALGRDRGLMRSLTSDLLGSEVARRFIPVAILAPFLVGWLISWGLRTNLYDPSYALSLMSMSMVAIWLGLIKQNSGILNRMDDDRKQTQAIIGQQLGEIEAIYRMAPIGLSFIDTDLKFVRINKQLAQINGLSVSKHIGRTIREVLPEMADTIEPLYQQVIDSGEPIIDLEVSGTAPSQPGMKRYWLASYHPQKDANNRVVGVNATILEITDRKREEAALRESEQKFSAIFNNSFGLMGLFSLDGVVLDVNQAALESIAGQPSDIIGKKCWETPWWEHSPRLQHQLQNSIVQAASGQFVRYEVEFPNPNGEVTTTDFSLKPVCDETGAVVTIVAEGRNITALKQAQADLEQRNQELDSFVHIVAHDLKAPLRGISNLSQWIEEDLEGQLLADNQQQMTLLRSRVRRMESIINGLLDYARVGKVEAKIEPVVVAELLAETIDSIAPPPTFKIVIDPTLPTLHTKRLLLFQVFANLIGNGIKHHDRLDGSLHISAAERGDCYEFRVTDDGPGIAPDYQDKIFAIFQSGNTCNKQDSSGIGLNIVKKIVETEGGSIWLQSQLGQGTTFYFTWKKC